MSYKAQEIAYYFLKLDNTGDLFNKNLIEKNNRKFFEGNARLNKYLHLAQNIYYAKTGELLFDDQLYAYDNGGVVPEIQENYKLMLAKKNQKDIDLPDEIQEFLNKIYIVLKNAPIDKLIDLSHEDSEWLKKHMYYKKEDQVMDTLANYDEYKDQYKDIIFLMDRMDT